MGRVTFLDDEVAARLNRDFAPTWKNCHPGYRVEHLEGDRFDEIRKIPNGQASENVATLVCTPDGEILHVVPGHWKPKDFLVELDFAQTVLSALDGAADRREVVRKLHRERLAAIPRNVGELGRRALETVHRRMIEEPLRRAEDVRGVADYALAAPTDERQRRIQGKMQRLHEALARKLEPLMREGKLDELEAALDELIRRIEK